MNEQECNIKEFARKGFLLDQESMTFFQIIKDFSLNEKILNTLFNITKSRVVSKKVIESNLFSLFSLLVGLNEDQKNQICEFFKIKELHEQKKEPLKSIEKVEKDIYNLKILSNNIIPYKKIEVKDFVYNFRNRYTFIKDILKERKELSGLVSINKIESKSQFSIIAMVSRKRHTKNKNLVLDLEDLTGRISALISKDKEELLETAKEIVPDDIIGLKCNGNKDFLYISDIFFPEAYIFDKKKTNEEAYALFLSDVHIGSKLFLKENFEKFISWINGENVDEETKERIKKIKYIFFLGDNIDGVGVYPSQESLLNIKDVREQYNLLYFYLNKIPKNICLIMCPGQHDAVRVPEPQPPISKEFGNNLLEMENLFLVSNPALIEIESDGFKKGIKVLMYHGASMHGWVDEIEQLRKEKANLYPSKVVKHMLKHRHLSPIHGANVYIPGEKEDPLLIKEVPDIISTGDLHRTDVDIYNNILIICSSCWQSITPFEEKIGNQPDPCKVPLLNLKTREIKILDFT
jgi:DNA polymerase II small subunit